MKFLPAWLVTLWSLAVATCPAAITLAALTEQDLIEIDWRKQDGIGTALAPSTYAAAIERTFATISLIVSRPISG